MPLGDVDVTLSLVTDERPNQVDDLTTAGDGSYSFESLSSGHYVLSFNDTTNQYTGSTTEFDLAVGKSKHVSPQLTSVEQAPDHRFTGTVDDAATHSSLDGILVQAFLVGGSQDESVASDESYGGAFSLYVPAGNYTVKFSDFNDH